MTAGNFERIGFIGLGVMGGAMCRNLIAKGSWPVTAFDRNPEALAGIAAAGARAAASAAEVVGAADAVITCLPGGAEVRALVLGPPDGGPGSGPGGGPDGGPGGILGRLRAGQVLIDMSTSPPALAEEIAAAAAARGAFFADAPIARTRQAAVDGTLAIMVGAEPAVFEAVRPLLATMGTEVVRCGGPGAGQVVKVLNNMVLFQTVAALAGAITLAERAGVAGAVLLDTLSKGSGDSFALRNHGQKSLLPQDYPDQAFSVSYAAKDLSYALELAAEHGVEAPGAAAVAELFERAIAAGDGDRYFPVIRKHLV
jgi:3-hydroxyisobutyrate dehydrogenase-like beta-hydroxyacid dehydrogenase